MTRLLARIELFKKIINVQGSIMGCGVYSEMVCFLGVYYVVFPEPIGGILRQIIGFDTFEDFHMQIVKILKKVSLNGKKVTLK